MAFDAVAFLARRGAIPSARDAEATVLTGGFWSEVLRVRCGDEDLAVKHFGESDAGPTLFPIAPETEARAMRLLRGRGIAPNFAGFWPAAEGRGAVLAYRFVEGARWAGDVAEAAALLRRVHRIETSGFRDMPASPRELLADADSLPAPPADDPWAARLDALRPSPVDGPRLARRRFVHGDFNAGNMIAGPDGGRVIDWQCPGMGDPAEDLWSFLSPAFQAVYGLEPRSVGDEARFLAAYGDKGAAARLGVLRPYFAWRYARHCVARARAVRDRAASARYRAAAVAAVGELERAGGRSSATS